MFNWSPHVFKKIMYVPCTVFCRAECRNLFYLYTLQDLAYITQRPQAYVSHGKSRLIIAIGIASDLVLFIIHKTLYYQTVAPGHVHRCVLVRIKACYKHETEGSMSSIWKYKFPCQDVMHYFCITFFSFLSEWNTSPYESVIHETVLKDFTSNRQVNHSFVNKLSVFNLDSDSLFLFFWLGKRILQLSE